MLLDVGHPGDSHHGGQEGFDLGRPHDEQGPVPPPPQHLEEEEGPAEGVVGVEVRDHHDVEALGRQGAAAQVGERRGRGLHQHGAVDHEAVPVAARGEEVPRAQERERGHRSGPSSSARWSSPSR